MRSSAWIALLRIVPPELTDQLMAIMTSGSELTISGVCRFEQDFMVIRARLAGTTDDPSIVFLPYDKIDYMGFRRPMKDADVESLFANNGGYQSPPAEVMAAAGAPSVAMPIPVPPPAPVPITRVAPTPAPAPAPAPVPTGSTAPLPPPSPPSP